MATKLKVRITRPINELSPRVQAWIAKYNIKFDRYGYADAPRSNENDLYGESNNYHVPLDPQVWVYQTLDNKYYFTTGKAPIHERRRMVTHPLIVVVKDGNDVYIGRREVIRGQEVATLHEEVLYSGPVECLPPHLTFYEALHTQVVLEELRMKEDPDYFARVLKKRHFRRRRLTGRGNSNGRRKRFSRKRKPWLIRKGKSQ